MLCLLRYTQPDNQKLSGLIKTTMKILKKISLVYTLQIFAVILLFGYAVASPVIKPKEAVIDGIVPLEINKLPPVQADYDSIFTINTLQMYTGKSGN
jgi:hypothetical protein